MFLNYLNDMINFTVKNNADVKNMNGKNRKDIKPGKEVFIVLKKDQRTGKRSKGVVADILTNKSFHPHGIKVRLSDGRVGRVQEIVDSD